MYIGLDCRVVVNGCKYLVFGWWWWWWWWWSNANIPAYHQLYILSSSFWEKENLLLSVVTCKGQFRHWTYNNQNVGTQFHINWTLQLDPFSTNLANKNVPNKSWPLHSSKDTKRDKPHYLVALQQLMSPQFKWDLVVSIANGVPNAVGPSVNTLRAQLSFCFQTQIW